MEGEITHKMHYENFKIKGITIDDATIYLGWISSL